MQGMLTAAQIGKSLSDMNKAISETNVSNGNLVREDLQSQLVVMGPMETPLRNRISRIAGNGAAHAFYRMKPNADVSQGPFYGTTPSNGVFPKGGLPTDATEAYQYVSYPYFNIGDVAQVTFQDQAQGKSFMDLMAQRTKVKTLNAAMIEEFFILWGDSAEVQDGGGYIFDGLLKQISTLGGQVHPSTDGTITLGTFSEVQKMQFDAGGTPRVIVIDSKAKGILTNEVAQLYALQGLAGAANFTGMQGGLSVRAWDFGYGPVDWIVSRYLVADPYSHKFYALSLDDRSMDGQNDGNVITMADVDPMHSIDLAIVATAWRKVIYETTTLIVSAPAFQGLITNLTYAGQTVGG